MIRPLFCFILITISCVSAANTDVLQYLYVDEFGESKPSVVANDISDLAGQLADYSESGEVAKALALSASWLRQNGFTDKNKPELFVSELSVSKLLSPEVKQLSAMMLMNHGMLEVAGGDLAAGRETIERGLQLIEDSAISDSPFTVKGHIAAGIADAGQKNIKAARNSFQQAQHLIHRTHGVYAIEQVVLLDYLSLLERMEGDFSGSDALQEFILLAAERTYGSNSPQMLEHLAKTGRYFAARGGGLPIVSIEQLRPGHAFLGAKLCRWGSGPRFRAVPCNPGLDKWQAVQLRQSQAAAVVHNQRVDAFARSIELFERAIAIHEQQIGNMDLDVIGTMRALAKVYIQKDDLRRAERTMKRAIAASELHARSAEERMGILISMGDLLQSQGNSESTKHYLAAWRLIQQEPTLSDEFGHLFEVPVRLAPENFRWSPLKLSPEKYVGIKENSLYVRASYEVSKKGRLKEINILESTVPVAQERDIKRQLRQARFRPKISNGKIVASLNHTHRFNYPVPDYLLERTEIRPVDLENVTGYGQQTL